MKIKYRKDYKTVYYADENIKGVYPLIDANVDISVQDLEYFRREDMRIFKKLTEKLYKILEEI
ncbi:MAG: hypothetical protein ACXADH_10315 [Candidatus Kariarchaeaceae archaeon]|jgi:hypothetical protein